MNILFNIKWVILLQKNIAIPVQLIPYIANTGRVKKNVQIKIFLWLHCWGELI